MKIGILGGTFNPIHYGHLRAADEAREKLGLDRVLFIPSGSPPLKADDIADAGQRLKMTELAVRGNPYFEVLDIESRRPVKSYTVDTLTSLLGTYPEAELYFMLGIDAFLDIPNWYRPDRLMSMVNFVLMSRPGRSFLDIKASPYLRPDADLLKKMDNPGADPVTVRLDTGREIVMLNVTPLGISSSDIRKRLKSGASIKYLLPEQVESFIILHCLYTDENKKN
ncbi:MAG: nicotinate-nucleotide adenylyltransferase [Nitrospirae bacterium]|nr:nicotinate-nucleotide adenylyltransferase [Nitrospirota bacterium]